MFVPCFLCNTFVFLLVFFNHRDGEKRAGCFILIVFLVYFFEGGLVKEWLLYLPAEYIKVFSPLSTYSPVV